IGVLRVSTFCEVEMLTTASITFSAMSAMLSGPRASDEVESAGKTIAAAANVATAGRRNCRTKQAKLPSMDVWAPEVRNDLGETVLPSGNGRKGDLDALGRRLGRNRDRASLPPLIAASSAHDPDKYDTEHSGDDARHPQRCFRALERAR